MLNWWPWTFFFCNFYHHEHLRDILSLFLTDNRVFQGFILRFCQKLAERYTPTSLSFSQAHIGKLGICAPRCPETLPSMIKLPPSSPMQIFSWLLLSSFLPSGPTTLRRGWFRPSPSYIWRVWLVSQTKFDYIVQSMSQNDAVKVLDLISATPTDNPYGHLKSRLLRMYDLTD